ncbi:MAG TPA: Crp/Fnr family transcriptional regulator [Anaerolineales bacterium]|nr:Crp/Fnr family transcriptional regulator [Anaerolineales bacterium]
MIDKAHFDRMAMALPLLRSEDAGLVREFRQTAFHARIPAGRDVFVEGDRVDSIALLIRGVVRVYKMGETGRQITLYRFGDGQSCILTANAILSQKTFPAVATVEREAEAAMVPAQAFRDWVRRHEAWREYVFDLLSARLASVMETVDEVVFRRMDARVAAFLAERADAINPIPVTHQEIAAELGSSREVVSRLLEDLAERGLVRISRGQVDVLDQDALAGRGAKPGSPR